MARTPSVVVPTGAPARARGDEERTSPARRRELAEEFGRLVATRRTAAADRATARSAEGVESEATRAEGADASRRRAAPGVAGGADRLAEGIERGAERSAVPAPERVDDALGRRLPSQLVADEPGAPSGDAARLVGARPSAEAAPGSALAEEVPGDARLDADAAERTARERDEDRAPRPPARARDGDDTDTGSTRAAGAEGRLPDPAPSSGESAPAPGDTAGRSPTTARSAERIASLAETMSSLLADTARFADPPPADGAWRFTLLDGDDVALGFSVTRHADGARSVALEEGGERHAPLLEELRRRLSALDADVRVETGGRP